ncbi:MAG: HAMP domain-containing histidine kinase [Bacteroidales bacterium]|nr:HAMP domain-containing histidine kinase [Bacteroidales bacterium]
MKCFRHLIVFIFIALALTGNKCEAFARTETIISFGLYPNIPLSIDDAMNPKFYNCSISSKTNVKQTPDGPNSHQLTLIPGNFNYMGFGIIALVFINIILFYFYIKKKKSKKRLKKENQEYQEQLKSWKQSYSDQKSFLHAIPEILLVINNTHIVVDVKSHNQSLLPLPAFKIINHSITEVFPARESQILVEHIQKTLSENSIQSFRLTSSGKYANFEVQMIPLHEDQVLTLFRDISRENKLLENLEHSLQNLNETHTARDKFFSIIAHDLKNPFNALIGFSSLLNEEFDSLTDEENKEYIKQIYQSSESLFNLLRNLLAWTKSKTGELDYNPQEIDFNSTLNENIKIVKPEAQQKNIKIQPIISNDPVFISGDKNMLNSIIRNLTANAIKFTNTGGTISVSTKRKEDFIECAISDNGIGISDDNIKNIFRKENKYRRQGTKNEDGTGLGLLLCKEFVEKHGGEIWVESEQNQGSTFYFTLPLSR